MNSMELNVASAHVPHSSWRDMLGIAASIGCAIHCAAMPFVIAYLPALGLSFLADAAFHKWMALICFLIALAAFLPGLVKHGNWVPVGVGSVGLVLITFAAFGLAGECCHSCDSASPANANTFAALQSNTFPPEYQQCDGCEQQCDGCEFCAVDGIEPLQIEAVSLESNEAAPEEEKDLLGLLAPWLTPFGGLLLVAAHVINGRCGSNCQCCSTEPKTHSVSTT